MQTERLERFLTHFSRRKLQAQDLDPLDLAPLKTQTQHLVRVGLVLLEYLNPVPLVEPPVHLAVWVLAQQNLLEHLGRWESGPLPPLPHLV